MVNNPVKTERMGKITFPSLLVMLFNTYNSRYASAFDIATFIFSYLRVKNESFNKFNLRSSIELLTQQRTWYIFLNISWLRLAHTFACHIISTPIHCRSKFSICLVPALNRIHSSYFLLNDYCEVSKLKKAGRNNRLSTFVESGVVYKEHLCLQICWKLGPRSTVNPSPLVFFYP